MPSSPSVSIFRWFFSFLDLCRGIFVPVSMSQYRTMTAAIPSKDSFPKLNSRAKGDPDPEEQFDIM